MPYTIKNPPDRIKALPKHAQEIWIAAYNSAHKQYDGDEDIAARVAIAAVKKKYKKNKDGKWVKKMSEPRFVFDVSLDFKEMPDGKYKSMIPIARTGKWKHPEYGEFEISSKDLNEIEANFGTTRESQPPVNYEHGEGVDASIGAAGWIQSITRNNGRLEGEVYWTKDAWDKIQEGAFKYISPEIRFNYKNKENGKNEGTVLTGAALTTKPWIEDLVIDLSEKRFQEESLALVELAKELKKGGKTEMDIKTLIEKLNLNEDATEEDVINTIEELLNKPEVDLTDIRQKLELDDDADVDAIIEVIDEIQEKLEKEPEPSEEETELSEQVTSLSETVKDLTTQLAESEKKREAIEVQLREKDFEVDFDGRLREGKVLPKMKDWAKGLFLADNERYNSIMDTMPVMVDLSERGASTQGETDVVKKFNDEMKKLQDEKELSYREAIMIVAREQPDLWMEYRKEIKGGKL